MEHQTLGRRFICPIGPATEHEFILDWRISSHNKELLNRWMNFTKKTLYTLTLGYFLKLKRTLYRKLQTLKFLRMRAPLVCCLNTYLLSTCYTTQHSNHFANSKICTYLIKSVNPRMKFWCLQISQKANQILDWFLPSCS